MVDVLLCGDMVLVMVMSCELAKNTSLSPHMNTHMCTHKHKHTLHISIHTCIYRCSGCKHIQQARTAGIPDNW